MSKELANVVRECFGDNSERTMYYGTITDALFSGLHDVAKAFTNKSKDYTGRLDVPSIAESLHTMAEALQCDEGVDVTPVVESLEKGFDKLTNKDGMGLQAVTCEIHYGFQTLADSIRYLADAIRTNPKE
jgi:hypothetical protein